MITKKQRENNKLRLEINEELRDWPNSIGESDGEDYFRGFSPWLSSFHFLKSSTRIFLIFLNERWRGSDYWCVGYSSSPEPWNLLAG